MANDLWNIVLNVVATFVYAAIMWLWKSRRRRSPPPPQPPPPPLRQSASTPGDDETPIDRRARNRQALETAAYRFVFYVTTFGVLYLSVTMPPLLKTMLSKTEVLLSDARVIGELLPPVPIGKSYLQATFFLVAAVLYVPLLFLAESITPFVSPVVDAFVPVTHRIWSAITMLTFLLFCIPTAATSIWLYYDKPFQDAVLIVLVGLVMAFALVQAPVGRK
jgi:hypothetical protein